LFFAGAPHAEWLSHVPSGAQMVAVMPTDLLGRFGECLDTPLNGSFWSLPSRFETEIVEELEGRGYRVFKRETCSLLRSTGAPTPSLAPTSVCGPTETTSLGELANPWGQLPGASVH
jgi:hypothetical protein